MTTMAETSREHPSCGSRSRRRSGNTWATWLRGRREQLPVDSLVPNSRRVRAEKAVGPHHGEVVLTHYTALVGGSYTPTPDTVPLSELLAACTNCNGHMRCRRRTSRALPRPSRALSGRRSAADARHVHASRCPPTVLPLREAAVAARPRASSPPRPRWRTRGELAGARIWPSSRGSRSSCQRSSHAVACFG